MKQVIAIVAILALVLFTPSSSQAQFHLGIGPAVGMNFNLHTGSDLDNTGTGFGIVFGGEADMQFSKTFGMIGRMNFYDNRSGSTSKSGTQGGVNYTQDNSASIAYLNFEALLTLALPQSPIFFFAGPSIGFNIEGSYEVTTTITSQGVTFQGGSTKQTAKGSFQDMLARFELKLGAGYDYAITKKIALVPQLSFGFGLTKVKSDVSWRILTFQLLVPVRFSIM